MPKARNGVNRTEERAWDASRSLASCGLSLRKGSALEQDRLFKGPPSSALLLSVAVSPRGLLRLLARVRAEGLCERLSWRGGGEEQEDRLHMTHSGARGNQEKGCGSGNHEGKSLGRQGPHGEGHWYNSQKSTSRDAHRFREQVHPLSWIVRSQADPQHS